ncbi:galactose-3-O-sulfotransferase 3-like [Branchiostoma floridae]|uniref:Galactose-3-O-sulfotransferase 3-like n=2 Tax=Branchiostoma floridae TaxID=7739 RepID=A0A9J7LQN9_BRAFL|nr:galactose-3-O-sulfotransferase 3-like [Branchiostoma floridae]
MTTARIQNCSTPVFKVAVAIFCLGLSLCLQFMMRASVEESSLPGQKGASDTSRPWVRGSISFQRSHHGPNTCNSKTKLAFINVHKASSGTIMQVIQRFGYLRKLSFVQHISKDVNGLYPDGLSKPEILMPPQGENYDILTYHTVYDRPNIVRLLTPDAKFVTILREPFKHFASAFAFYGYNKTINVTAPNQLEEFLENPGFYDNLTKRSPMLFPAKKPMAVDLGFSSDLFSPSLQMNKIGHITRKFIDKLSHEFDLVMMAEHIDESLVLLRRLMCWDLKDILYYKYVSNDHSSDYDTSNISQRLRDNHEKWDAVDYALYKYFNETMWKKISIEGKSFVEELAHFRDVELKLRVHCSSEYSALEPIVISETPWNSPFKIDSEYCTWLTTSHLCYYYLIKDRNRRYQAGSKGLMGNDTVPRDGVFFSPPYCSTECDKIKQECSLHEYVQHCYQEGLLRKSQSSSQKIKFLSVEGEFEALPLE